MPPQIHPLRCLRGLSALSNLCSSTFPPSSLLLLVRHSSILSSLSDTPGSYNKAIRRGRGPSSGKGKTSGRGHKGQKQHGKVPKGFQGGQTTQEVVQGKRGFENGFSVDMSPLNLDRLQEWVDRGRLDPARLITLKELAESRCLHGVKRDGVKLLARGAETLRTPLNILVSRASTSAIAAIEAAGGSITTRYYSPLSIRRILRGESDSTIAVPAPPPLTSSPSSASSSPTPADPQRRETDPTRPFAYRLPDPTSRKDMEYYRDPAHRGYLAHLVPEGEGPSLFFKTPGGSRGLRVLEEGKEGKGVDRAGRKKEGRGKGGENRIW
ncbi:MAG: YmL10 [Caeruleum heppii]|nr:MAG: YmL10 [Caeruleum heppii]